MESKTLSNYKQFKELSDWTVYDDYCLVRYKKGTDIEDRNNRMAFIEKTPRVRCENIIVENEDFGEQHYWIYGNKGESYSEIEGEDIESCMWCDKMLELMGWE